MATVYITIGRAGARGDNDSVPVFLGDTVTTEVVTSSIASAQTVAITSGDRFASIFCETAIMALSGVNPTASATAGIYCPAGIATSIAVQAGHKIAVIDAA